MTYGTRLTLYWITAAVAHLALTLIAFGIIAFVAWDATISHWSEGSRFGAAWLSAMLNFVLGLPLHMGGVISKMLDQIERGA